MRQTSPPDRWALTPPFHPYPFWGGIFSVALSVGFPLPPVRWPAALWSPDFPLSIRQRLPAPLYG